MSSPELGVRRVQLATLTADLPPVTGQVQAKDLITITKRCGDIKRTSRLVFPRRMEIRAHSGDVKLDFTRAVIIYGSFGLHIDQEEKGRLTLVIRPGIVVDAEEVNVTPNSSPECQTRCPVTRRPRP